jgi:hypothetical protein
MIAAPNILTPQGEQPVRIEFGAPRDDAAVRAWRTGSKHRLPVAAADAVEFAKLAGKRWRYYLKRDEAATSLRELKDKLKKQPQGEIGFLLVARPTWKPAPSALGIAWCRRTWCNHIVLDFLAAHPLTLDPANGYKGTGVALLRTLAIVAQQIGCPLVWGEATAVSAPFYEKVLGGQKIQDHFFIRQEMIDSLQRKLTASQP